MVGTRHPTIGINSVLLNLDTLIEDQRTCSKFFHLELEIQVAFMLDCISMFFLILSCSLLLRTADSSLVPGSINNLIIVDHGSTELRYLFCSKILHCCSWMAASKFYLNIAGDTFCHCVAVIISVEIELPFEDILDYRFFIFNGARGVLDAKAIEIATDARKVNASHLTWKDSSSRYTGLPFSP
ncbi:hypothetical protein L1987_47351 [Smallanthus sonchifolius]|uniref:Uncharacterized protein n=1 Tax=Smallanthus sonchifolius TaxID=185202 RepID=A0ACB9G3D4_9ASTR|nr:hypothetical protein L1987_47351 [Smallanthus sonchifolius]